MAGCKECREFVGHFNELGKRVFDVDGVHIGVYCIEHGKIKEDTLKESRLVEEYNLNNIYQKDVQFYPYWECRYSFDKLEDVRLRIRDKHLVVVKKRELKSFLDDN